MRASDLFRDVRFRLGKYLKQSGDVQFASEFVGATPASVHAWAKGKRQTEGVKLIKLWVFLREAGYASPEFEKMQPFNKLLCRLLAYSIITIEEVQQIVNVARSSTAIQVMFGRKPANPSMNVDDLDDLFGEQLVKAEQAFSQRLDELGFAIKTGEPADEAKLGAPLVEAKPVSTHVPEGLVTTTRDDASIMTLATLLSAALPLARNINSNRCTPEDRSRFRDLMGDGGVFEISNILNALCSERARKEMKGV